MYSILISLMLAVSCRFTVYILRDQLLLFCVDVNATPMPLRSYVVDQPLTDEDKARHAKYEESLKIGMFIVISSTSAYLTLFILSKYSNYQYERCTQE